MFLKRAAGADNITTTKHDRTNACGYRIYYTEHLPYLAETIYLRALLKPINNSLHASRASIWCGVSAVLHLTYSDVSWYLCRYFEWGDLVNQTLFRYVDNQNKVQLILNLYIFISRVKHFWPTAVNMSTFRDLLSLSIKPMYEQTSDCRSVVVDDSYSISPVRYLSILSIFNVLNVSNKHTQHSAFLSFLDSEMAQVLQILHCEKQWPVVCSAYRQTSNIKHTKSQNNRCFLLLFWGLLTRWHSLSYAKL